ncbi:uncharacterized protein LOC128670224 [Plodia interpunctella]|uniref:uncharacterized protein LOC128670224 n=1 Tax=Plodia interpunctella TaxID=58824 RepID=UPI0023679DD2|nr:uncharacterized protein LOC128670224 [Plodia interpunctella]
MSPLLKILTALAIAGVASASKHHGKNNTCQEFTQGLMFNETLAVGSWHLLHYSTDKANGSGDSRSHCIQIIPVTDKDRRDLSDLVGKFVENLKWENLTLKMQIPCSAAASNRTRDYYLEKLENDGSYRTLQIPHTTAKLDLAEFHRYPMRLKIIENQYLGMMDCHEKFLFLLGKHPPGGKPVDDRLRKMIEIYWPEDRK